MTRNPKMMYRPKVISDDSPIWTHLDVRAYLEDMPLNDILELTYLMYFNHIADSLTQDQWGSSARNEQKYIYVNWVFQYFYWDEAKQLLVYAR